MKAIMLFVVSPGMWLQGITNLPGFVFFQFNGDKIPVSNSSGRTWSSQLLLQYGITDNFQVTAGLPYLTQDLFLSYYGEAPGLDQAAPGDRIASRAA